MLLVVATLCATALHPTATTARMGAPSARAPAATSIIMKQPWHAKAEGLAVPDLASDVKKPPSVSKAAAQIKKEKLTAPSSDKMDQMTDAIANAFVFVSGATSKVKAFADENDLGTKAKALGVGARDTASKLVESSDDLIDQAKSMPTNFVTNNFIITARAVLEVLGDEVKPIAAKLKPTTTTATKTTRTSTTTRKAAASHSTKPGSKPSPIKSEKKAKKEEEKKSPFDFF